MHREMMQEWQKIKRQMGSKYCLYFVTTDFDGEVFCKFLKSMGVKAEPVDCFGQVKIDNPAVNPLVLKYAKAEPGDELFNTVTSVSTPVFIKSITRECEKYGIVFKMVSGSAIKVCGDGSNGSI